MQVCQLLAVICCTFGLLLSYELGRQKRGEVDDSLLMVHHNVVLTQLIKSALATLRKIDCQPEMYVS